MREIDFDGRRFRTIRNSDAGESSSETVFHYRQKGSVVWATYHGGDVSFGTLLARSSAGGHLEMVYQHLNKNGDFRAVSFVLAFSAAGPLAGPAEGVLWFEAGHESGGARGVQGAVDELFSADNGNDIDRLAGLFEEDGVWLPPTGEVVAGRHAFSAWYRARHVRWA